MITTSTMTHCEGSPEPHRFQEEEESEDTTSKSNSNSCSMLLDEKDDTMLQMILHHLTVELPSQLYDTYRIVLRCMKLLYVFSPVIVLYPLYHYYCYYYHDKSGNIHSTDATENRDAHEIVLGITKTNHDDTSPSVSHRERFIQYYYKVCLYCVELSGGATIIKFLQWMSSRPDLFGHEFCHVFCKLQDHTTPHPLKYTELCMMESYGPDWKDFITLHEIIGSGCIGQVYRGTVKIMSSSSSSDVDIETKNQTVITNSSASSSSSSEPQYKEVAVKVIHPNVRDDIDTDMDIIRHMISLIQYINPNIKKHCQYLNIKGVLDEFQKLLKLQMDLRYEARNLERFQENFSQDPVVQFPQLLYQTQSSTNDTPSSISTSASSASLLMYPPNENVLIETFCDGIPILQYCRENHRSNATQLTKLCYHGIRAVCQMIFLDNFVHGTSTLRCEYMLFFNFSVYNKIYTHRCGHVGPFSSFIVLSYQ